MVCTQGARGAIALEPGRDVVRVPAEPVQEVVDTNGAGDAFFAGFLQAHLLGWPTAECLDRGARTAAACVRSRDLAGAVSHLAVALRAPRPVPPTEAAPRPRT